MAKKRMIVGRIWTAEEMALLKELYPVKPIPELAKMLGRTVPAVVDKAYSLGIRRKSWCEKLWTAEELELLRELYPTCESTRDVAKKIGRAWGSVRQKAFNLGITKGNRPRTFDRF
jgi:hypothetical protein